MIPVELCHYTRKDTALEIILVNKEIKFSQLRFTNDPMDSMVRPLPTFDSDVSGDIEAITSKTITLASNINPLASKIQLDEWKVLCLTKNLKPRIHKNGNDSLFLKGYCRPHMWAQYAENNKGVCLIFDGRRLHENIKNYAVRKQCKIFHGSVSYKNAYITLDPLNVQNFLKYGEKEIRDYYVKCYKTIFLTKYQDWKNESEYRWLIHAQTPLAEYVSIEGALKAVLVGRDFPEVYVPALKKICKKLKVSAGRMFWWYGAPHPSLDNIYKP
jgi:hypothetical protein